MTNLKTLTVILGLVLVALAFAPTAQADTWNKKTIVTFSHPVELPTGVVLQPGKYVMKLLDSASNRHIVQVFNEEENHVYATILAIPNYRLQPAEKTVITFHELPAGAAHPIRAWFYPGDNFGQEFAYPERRATQITQVTTVEVPRLSTEDEATLTARAQAPPAPEPVVEQQPVVQQQEPARETVVAQETRPAPAPMEESAETRETLPETASPIPALALMGLFSLAAGFSLRSIANRLS